MKKLKLSILIILTAFITTTQFSLAKIIELPGARMEVTCESPIKLGERLKVNYTLIINSDSPPEINNFDLNILKNNDRNMKILDVRKIGHSAGIQMVNGKPKYTTNSFKWQALVIPSRVGEFITPNYVVTFQNDTLKLAREGASYIVNSD